MLYFFFFGGRGRDMVGRVLEEGLRRKRIRN